LHVAIYLETDSVNTPPGICPLRPRWRPLRALPKGQARAQSLQCTWFLPEALDV